MRNNACGLFCKALIRLCNKLRVACSKATFGKWTPIVLDSLPGLKSKLTPYSFAKGATWCKTVAVTVANECGLLTNDWPFTSLSSRRANKKLSNSAKVCSATSRLVARSPASVSSFNSKSGVRISAITPLMSVSLSGCWVSINVKSRL